MAQPEESYEGWIVEVKENSKLDGKRAWWCGIYYKFNPPRIPAEIGELLAVRTIVFRTREQARALAAEIDNAPWPASFGKRNAIVRKVRVSLEVIGHG